MYNCSKINEQIMGEKHIIDPLWLKTYKLDFLRELIVLVLMNCHILNLLCCYKKPHTLQNLGGGSYQFSVLTAYNAETLLSR